MAEVNRAEVTRRIDQVGDLMRYILKHPEVLDAFPEEVYIPQDVDISRVFSPGRLELLRHISTGPRNVGDLARRVGRKVPAVSRDLRLLEAHGIIQFQQKGKEKRPVLRRRMVVVPLGSGG